MLQDYAPVRSPVDERFRDDVIRGFAARPQRTIPACWFYDRRGSELFEGITMLPEYYPFRTEVSLLERHCHEVFDLIGPGRVIVEFGSGSSVKTPILLRCIEPAAYVPIDISGDFLRESATMVAEAFPRLPVLPLEADFTGGLALPHSLRAIPKLGFFPGSTIGNMVTRDAVDLLRAMRETLGAGAMLLIGMDRLKDENTLIRAYDDRSGMTAAFNLNLLHRINYELTADIPIDAFRHRVHWNAWESRIEMHLEAMRDVAFGIENRFFSMVTGETIHTENSHKYSLDGARLLLRAGDWNPIGQWSDREEKFTIVLAEAA